MAQQWYYARDGMKHGPVSSGTLKRLADTGYLRPPDLVWREGLDEWSPAAAVKGLFPATAVPSPAASPHPRPGFEEDTPTSFGGGDLFAAVRRHLDRALAWDLQAVPAGAAEDALLSSRGIEGETARRYLVWRRSVLLAVILPTFISAVLRTVHVVEHDLTGLTPFGSLARGAVVASFFSLPLAALAAAVAWAAPRRSRAYVLAGWAAGLLVPSAVALCPAEWLIRVEQADMPAKLRELARFGAGFLTGAVYFVALMPSVLTLIPGLLRACLRVKSLLPESVLPGWLFVAAAPLYALLLLVLFVALNGAIGNALLGLGAALWLSAPRIFVARAGLLARPLTRPEDRAAFLRVQGVVAAVVALGLTLLLLFLYTKKVLDVHLVGFEEKLSVIPARRVLEFLIEYLGRTFYVTVLAADLLVRANVAAWRAHSDFAGAGPADFAKRVSQFEDIT